MCRAIKLRSQSCLFCFFVALGVVVAGFVLVLRRACAHLLLKQIHLGKLFLGEYCFASLAAELGCLALQDVKTQAKNPSMCNMVFDTWQFLVVPDDGGMGPGRCS